MDFNFDEMVSLYKSSPEEFENRRREIVNAEIAKAPIPRRNMLRMIQLECDMIHVTCEPEHAIQKISELMLDKAFTLNDSVASLSIACNALKTRL